MLAVTNDEEANLAIAIAVRLLNPKVPVIARARTTAIAANMASFGTDHVINPFERFAEYLALAVASPERFRLIELLTSLPESPDSRTAPAAARAVDHVRLRALRPCRGPPPADRPGSR